MCRFQDLSVGQKVTLTVTEANCVNCNTPFTYNGPALYNGHESEGNTMYDSFIFYIKFPVCGGCGEQFTRFRTRCDGTFSYEDTFIEAYTRS